MTAASAPLGPRGLPFVGHALSFLRDKPRFLLDCTQQYGDCVRLQIGGPTWLLNDPQDVKHVLVDAADHYEKTPKLTTPSGRELSGAGLHTATGSAHLHLRRMVQPLFHRRVVAEHEALVHDVAAQWMRAWRDGQVIDLWEEMLGLSQQVMLRALFGSAFVDVGGRFAHAVTTRRRYIEYYFTSNIPVPDRWPLPIVRRYRAARAVMHEVINREIAQRRVAALGEYAANDWLSQLVSAEGRDGERLNDAQVRDEAVTLTSTGYETVAAAITWTGHLLAQHDRVQCDVRDAMTIGEPAAFSNAVPTPSASYEGRTSILTRALDESMRLYPPTWLYVRMAVAPDTLPSGQAMALGDKLYIVPYTLHRHPAWYADPERFDPDRFLPEAVRARPRFTFFPFGGGARQCLGEPFARMEARLVLEALLQRFRLEPLTPANVPMRPSIVLEPRGGLPIRLRAIA